MSWSGFSAETKKTLLQGILPTEEAMTRSTKAITSATISVTAAQLQSLNLHLLTQSFFLLSEICDGGGLTKTSLKNVTLSLLIWTYPREMRTCNTNFKKMQPFYLDSAWKYCSSHSFARINFSRVTSMCTHFDAAAILCWTGATVQMG